MAVRESSCAPSKKGSFKATELPRAILFHRLDSRFRDVEGCIAAIRPDLDRLVDATRRVRPNKENLVATVEYDHVAWERVQHVLDRWGR